MSFPITSSHAPSRASRPAGLLQQAVLRQQLLGGALFVAHVVEHKHQAGLAFQVHRAGRYQPWNGSPIFLRQHWQMVHLAIAPQLLKQPGALIGCGPDGKFFGSASNNVFAL